MSVYTVSANGNESWKMIQDPRKNPGSHQNLGPLPALPKNFIRIHSELFE